MEAYMQLQLIPLPELQKKCSVEKQGNSLYVEENPLALSNGVRNCSEVVICQYYICSLFGNVCSTFAHRYSDICSMEDPMKLWEYEFMRIECCQHNQRNQK